MNKALNAIKNGIRAVTLLVMILALGSGTWGLGTSSAQAQTKLNQIPLGLGTTTNTTYTTNVYTWDGALATNYTTNVVITPTYANTNYPSGATGKTNIVNWGATITSPNPSASGANQWTLQNGWLLTPPNVQIWQDVIIGQVGTTTNGTCWFGYDLSSDAGVGTSNTPVRVPVTLTTAGTNEYFVLLGNTQTNLMGQYVRWDYFSTDFGTAVSVLTNKLIWRSGGLASP